MTCSVGPCGLTARGVVVTLTNDRGQLVAYWGGSAKATTIPVRHVYETSDPLCREHLSAATDRYLRARWGV